jgi:hypothetical protein
MRNQKADVGNDFASVLSRAQEIPTPDQAGRDLPDSFPFNPPNHHHVVEGGSPDPRALEGVTSYPFRIHRRVFTLWRPWSICSRCKQDLASGQVVLPSVGDYECPHNDRDAYERIGNDILAGRLLMGSEQEVAQRDGTIVISLRWYEPVPTKKAIREAAKARALARSQGADGASPPSPSPAPSASQPSSS